jgi:hypothetical protein
LKELSMFDFVKLSTQDSQKSKKKLPFLISSRFWLL